MDQEARERYVEARKAQLREEYGLGPDAEIEVTFGNAPIALCPACYEAHEALPPLKPGEVRRLQPLRQWGTAGAYCDVCGWLDPVTFRPVGKAGLAPEHNAPEPPLSAAGG